MSRLLIISGPTATGKTTLAVQLAKKFNGELVSADSRQVYRGLNVGVGKDHPSDIKLHLIDLIDPDSTFSVAQYRLLALRAIADIQSRGKLPIVVGCSGLYIDSIINQQPGYSVKPNRLLRLILDRLPITILQFILRLFDLRLFSSLNNSDINNPRRLIRKIEIRLPRFARNDVIARSEETKQSIDYLHLSLAAPNSYLYPRIDARVVERLKLGHLSELTNLLHRYSWSSPGLRVSAYYVFKEYFQKKSSIDNCIQKWKYLEHRDARRQKTWFKKQSNTLFVNVTKAKYCSTASRLVRDWLKDDKIHHDTTKS